MIDDEQVVDNLTYLGVVSDVPNVKHTTHHNSELPWDKPLGKAGIFPNAGDFHGFP